MDYRKFKCNAGYIFQLVTTQNSWAELFCTRICRNTLTKLHTGLSTSVWARICRALRCPNLKEMLFWERSRSWSSMYYGSGRATRCQDNRAMWNLVNGCLNRTFWVSTFAMLRQVTCNVWAILNTEGSRNDFYYLSVVMSCIWLTCADVSEEPAACTDICTMLMMETRAPIEMAGSSYQPVICHIADAVACVLYITSVVIATVPWCCLCYCCCVPAHWMWIYAIFVRADNGDILRMRQTCEMLSDCSLCIWTFLTNPHEFVLRILVSNQ
jgi:hypothetical protein